MDVQEFTQEARRFFYARRTKFRKGSALPPEIDHWGLWTKLGSGFYGEAWEHAEYPDLVVKISGCAGWGYESSNAPGVSRDEDMRVRADIWPDFAEQCMLWPHDNLPKVFHLERVGGLAWAVLPKYEEDSDARYSGIVQRFRNSMQDKAAYEHWMIPFVKLAKRSHVAVDMHSGNIMRDPETGEPIIIDPFSTTGYTIGTGEEYTDDRTSTYTDYGTDSTETTDGTTSGALYLTCAQHTQPEGD